MFIIELEVTNPISISVLFLNSENFHLDSMLELVF